MVIGVVAVIEHQYMLVPGLVLVLALGSERERPIFILLQVFVEKLILAPLLVFAIEVLFRLVLKRVSILVVILVTISRLLLTFVLAFVVAS